MDSPDHPRPQGREHPPGRPGREGPGADRVHRGHVERVGGAVGQRADHRAGEVADRGGADRRGACPREGADDVARDGSGVGDRQRREPADRRRRVARRGGDRPGRPGTTATAGATGVTALDRAEYGLVPSALVAETWKLYVDPLTSPVTTRLVVPAAAVRRAPTWAAGGVQHLDRVAGDGADPPRAVPGHRGLTVAGQGGADDGCTGTTSGVREDQRARCSAACRCRRHLHPCGHGGRRAGRPERAVPPPW